EKTLGTDHPDTATTYHNLGSLCDAQGKADEALEWLLRALRVWLSMKHYRTEEELLWIFEVYPRSSYAKEQEDPLDWLKSRLNAEEMLGVVFALLKLLQEQE
ncbi:MAG: tetratricopeptide repeat protein, partial [Oscillospiraceae bacterium]|nr:tetratricopeptide repeat protein [Oscillospiraceae bacterium]